MAHRTLVKEISIDMKGLSYFLIASAEKKQLSFKYIFIIMSFEAFAVLWDLMAALGLILRLTYSCPRGPTGLMCMNDFKLGLKSMRVEVILSCSVSSKILRSFLLSLEYVTPRHWREYGLNEFFLFNAPKGTALFEAQNIKTLRLRKWIFNFNLNKELILMNNH